VQKNKNNTMERNFLKIAMFLLIIVGISSGVSAQSGNALNFDGTDDFISVPSSESLCPTNALTIEAWIYTNSASDQMIVHKWNLGPQYSLDICSGKLLFYIYTGSYYSVTSSTDLPVNSWVHIAAVFDGSNLMLYENGVFNNIFCISPTSLGTGSGDLTIGRRSNVATEFFSGNIDEVRIWNVARSQANIQNNMNSTITSSDAQWANLAAYYQFDQGTAGGDNSGVTQLNDATSNGNNGTLSGFALSGTTSNWISTPFNVSTSSVFSTTKSSIQMNGSILGTGGNQITTRGFCYSTTNPSPTIADSKVEETGDFSIGSYSLTAESLTSSATYYYCAFATNSLGTTVYGSVKSVILAFTLGNALSFDGTDDYISLSSNPVSSATEFTFEAWVYLTANNNWNRIFDFGNSAGVNMLITSNQNNSQCPRFLINIGSGEQMVTSPDALPLNTWTHVAVTISGTTATMYLNGNQVAQNTSFTYNPASLGSTTNNYLGKSQYDNPYFCGKMDEVRIWNVAHTQSEIQDNMSNYLNGSETGLVAYYRFDQGNAENDNTSLGQLTECSNHCNQGILNNFALTGTTSNWVFAGIDGAPIVESTSTGTPDDNSTTMTGNIISAGASSVTTRGFQYATDACFTTDVNSESETGTFTVGSYSLELTGLSELTTYYVRAFSTNSEGTNYGSNLTVTTLKPEVPVDLTVSGYTIATGDTCFNATNEITVSTVTVSNNASANFIAGYSATLLPGFHAVSGSYVHAWITEDASFCDAVGASSIVSQPEVKSLDLDETKEKQAIINEIKVKVYPNPSNGQFNVAISGATEEHSEIQVYNLLGKKVYSGSMVSQATKEISINNVTKGLYIMKVTTGNESFIKKVIIQ
jgi:hypothetical protein